MDFLAGYILGLLSNYTYDKLCLFFRPKKREEIFRVLSDFSSWTSSDGFLFSYEKEPDFKIKINEGQDNLAVKYKRFPDRSNDKICWVEVKYNEATLFGWNFMYLDGYRLFVPVPKTEFDTSGNPYDYYNLSSLEIKVFEIIGSADLMGEPTKVEGLKRVAGILNITMTNL